MIMRLSIHPTKKIFARATPQESAMSRAKIAPAAARSDAVRGCSFGTPGASEILGAKLAAAASTATAAQRLATRAATGGRSSFAPLAAVNPGPLIRAALVSRCTPARWVAVKMDRHWRVPFGSGGAVAAATVLQPSCNREIFTIQSLGVAVARLQGLASRHARVRVCAWPCAHMRGLISATLQPFLYPSEIEGYYGYRTVAKRLPLQPLRRVASRSTEIRRFRNKIGGGYSIWATSCPSILPIRGQIDGRGGETFGAGIPAGALDGRVDGADLDQGAALERNGGNARVCGARIGHVHTRMFTHGALNGGNASVVEPRRKLCRLTGAARRRDLVGALGADRDVQAGGVAPPSAARPSLRPLAHAIFPISAESRFRVCPAGSPEARQVGIRQTGPGARSPLAVRHAVTGRGVIANLGLCRSGEPSAGGVHVN